MKIEVGKKYRQVLRDPKYSNDNIVEVVQYDGGDICYIMKNGEGFLSNIDELKPIHESPKPAHYDTGIDTIAFMRANCPLEQVEGFLRGNAIKYLQRYAAKGTPIEDLKKSRHYIDMLIEELEGRE